MSDSISDSSSSASEISSELECLRLSAREDRSRSGSQDTGASENLPSRESVSATLDKYVSASKDGREAFSIGNISEAVKEFDQALNIELQTEMDCLYDNSIGLMSGLVRSEVESRLDRRRQREISPKCSKVLQRLGGVYEEAAGEVKKRPDPQWYLQMGAALVVINEWDKAKAVYSEGINVCKNRKELKKALKDLTKIEQMTSYGEIPSEDQPIPNLKPSPFPSPNPSPRLSSRLIVTRSPAKSPARSPTRSPARSPAGSPATPRSRSNTAYDPVLSKSIQLLKQQGTRNRTASLSLDFRPKSNEEGTNSFNGTQTQTPPSSRKEKRRSLGLFSSKRTSAVLSGETESWSSCFDPINCQVLSPNEFQPSAITFMRELTARKKAEAIKKAHGNRPRLSFNAVALKSMRIEDDDSELDSD